MREVGIDLVTVGVFSWAALEPSPGEFDFDWLKENLDLLASHDIGADLATATASPPPWMAHLHPETLPRGADGTTLWPGGRQAFCPSSPVFRRYALRLCTQMAQRFASHPSLRMWHVSNELGCHNALCYCDTSADAFRAWLEQRYGDVAQLNAAWGTSFWSQRYRSFDEVLPPRTVTAACNPTQQMDFRRFSSDASLANFTAERDVLHALSPGIPVTTNFMVSEHVKELDYHRWAREVDVVANDHYMTGENAEGHRELAFCSDLVRGLADGGPWLLMETAASAVNWQPRNIAKQPGELLRNSMQHIARGADGVLFFQWRASRFGSERHHAALLPHAGTESRTWREVMELGRVLERLREVVGSRTDNQAAILFDYECWWAVGLDSLPSCDVTYLDQPHAFHRALTDLGVGVDVIHPDQDFSNYRLIIAPTLYTLTDETASRLQAAACGGATVVATYFSAITDKSEHVRPGGYGAALKALVGLSVEEWYPLREHERLAISGGMSSSVWSERVRLDGAEVIFRFADGPVQGEPAVTRHGLGSGAGWYVASRLDQEHLGTLVARIADEAQVRRLGPGSPGLELTERLDGARRWLFAVNHTSDPMALPIEGHDLVTDQPFLGTVKGGGVAVVRY